ncbi:DUF1016 N-terminal domain-containing protein [Citricoccus zhacaiensis]
MSGVPRVQTLRRVNTDLLGLYWRIGRGILARQQHQSWGSGVIGRLAQDLRAEFPQSTGFPKATCSTCGPLLRPGRTGIRMSHSLWDNFPGCRFQKSTALISEVVFTGRPKTLTLRRKRIGRWPSSTRCRAFRPS